MLDNRTLMLVESRRGRPGRLSMTLDHYYPLYELNQNGDREFALPSRNVKGNPVFTSSTSAFGT